MYACVGGGAPWVSVGRSFRVISGASGGSPGASRGELTERAPSLAL